jgi:hypothetical protein
MLANLGLPCTFADDARRGHSTYLNPRRMFAAQDKISEFAPIKPQGHPGHIRPNLADRLVLVEKLPAANATNFC